MFKDISNIRRNSQKVSYQAIPNDQIIYGCTVNSNLSWGLEVGGVGLVDVQDLLLLD